MEGGGVDYVWNGSFGAVAVRGATPTPGRKISKWSQACRPYQGASASPAEARRVFPQAQRTFISPQPGGTYSVRRATQPERPRLTDAQKANLPRVAPLEPLVEEGIAAVNSSHLPRLAPGQLAPPPPPEPPAGFQVTVEADPTSRASTGAVTLPPDSGEYSRFRSTDPLEWREYTDRPVLPPRAQAEAEITEANGV